MAAQHSPFPFGLVFYQGCFGIREELFEEVLAEDFGDVAAVGREHDVVGQVAEVQVVLVGEVFG